MATWSGDGSNDETLLYSETAMKGLPCNKNGDTAKIWQQGSSIAVFATVTIRLSLDSGVDVSQIWQ